MEQCEQHVQPCIASNRGCHRVAPLPSPFCLPVSWASTVVGAALSGSIRNGYLLCRPPGHHAERDRGMGFCVFNNIAVAAAHAMAAHGLTRVAVVDYDVHHGNGTQQIFWEDDR